VVAEPHLNLLRVEPVPEEHRRAAVAERVMADPRLGTLAARRLDAFAEAGSDRGGLEHPHHHVRLVDTLPFGAREHQVVWGAWSGHSVRESDGARRTLRRPYFDFGPATLPR